MRVKNRSNKLLKAVKAALILLPLCTIFFSQPVSAQVQACDPTLCPNGWTGYAACGFQCPTVMVNASGETCPGPNCTGVMDGSEIVCPDPDFTQYGLVRRIMPCIKETILAGVGGFVTNFVGYLANVVEAASVLAIALLGAMMVGGKSTAPLRDVVVLAAKLGAVAFFEHNLPFIFSLLLDGLDDMVANVSLYALSDIDLKDNNIFSYFGTISTSGATGDPGYCQSWIANSGDYYNFTTKQFTPTIMLVWDLLDCTMQMLLGGIFSGQGLMIGIMGFLLACMLSKGLGVTIGMIGFYLIVQLVWAVVRCLYIFIMGYMGVALCIIIAPILIPTLLFTGTKTFFTNWLQALCGFMLQPIIITAYMAMLLCAFDVVVFSGPYSLTRAIAGNAVGNTQDEMNDFMAGGGLGQWMFNISGYSTRTVGTTAVNLDSQNALPPTEVASDYGSPGNVATTPTPWLNNGGDFLDTIGVGSGGTHPNYFGVAMPFTAVDWDALTYYRNQEDAYGIDPPPPPEFPTTQSYLVFVLQAMIGAFLVAYIFLQMVEMIPFISAGLAAGGNASNLAGKVFGAGKLAPPGSEFVKNLKPTGNN